MKRREFMAALGGAVAGPLVARAQQPKRLPTIGFLGAGTASVGSQWAAAFVQRLRELNWIEDRTVAIEFRWADGHNERTTEIAAEFVRLKVDVHAGNEFPTRCLQSNRIAQHIRSRTRNALATSDWAVQKIDCIAASLDA